MELDRKTILVTGASSGIGAALVQALRRRGCQLALTARSEDKLRQLAGADALAIPGDLTLEDTRRRVVEETLARFGRIDVLINNAGVGLYASTWNADPAAVRRMFELNYFAPFDLIQRVAPGMRQRRSGAIVNISSIGGLVPLPWFTSYSATKFAVCGLTDGLRIELAGSGIHCMSVCPGYVKTDFQKNVIAGAPPDKLWRARRFAISAEECAEAAVRGLERNARTVVTPRLGWALVLGYRLFPSLVDRQLAKIHGGLGMS